MYALLGINRRTVKKLSQYDIEGACEYFKHGVQRRSGFDIAKSFIEAKLSIYGGIKSSNLYHQVIERYPEIKLCERDFRKYVSKLKASMVLPSEKQRYFEPVVSWAPGEYMQVDMGEKSVVLSDQSRVARVTQPGSSMQLHLLPGGSGRKITSGT